MTERVIRVTIDPATGPGAAKVQGDLGKIDTGIKKVRDSQGRLRTEQGRFLSEGSKGLAGMAKQSGDLATRFKQLVTVGAFLALARQAIGLADEYTRLTNQLKLVTEGSENLALVQSELFQLAQDTRSPLESTATLYAKIARNAKELGLGQSEVLGITKAVNQAIQVGGGTASEASAGVIQFAQALASGVLRGDELRSILENMPRLAQGLSQGLGVSIGELRKMGEEGQLTSEKVIGALQKTAPGIAAEFEKMTPTIGSAFTTLRNSLVVTIGELSNASGVGQVFAQTIIDASKFVTELGGALMGTLTPTQDVSDSVKSLATVLITVYSILESIVTIITGAISMAFGLLKTMFGGFAASVGALLSGDLKAATFIAEETFRDMGKHIAEGWEETTGELVSDMSSAIEKVVMLWDTGARKAAPAQGQLLKGEGIKKTSGVDDFNAAANEIRKDPLYNPDWSPQGMDMIGEFEVAGMSTEIAEESLKGIEDAAAASWDRIQYNMGQIKDTTSEYAKEAARNIQGSFAEFLFDPFADGLEGMLEGFVNTMRKIAAEALAAKAMEMLSGALSKSGNPYLSAVGGILGGRANGGSVQAGVPVMVNEKASQSRRPEVFVPTRSGRVTNDGGQAPAPVQPPDNIFVRDESEIPNAIASRRGRSAIVTLVSNYPGDFRRALGI